MDSSSSPVPGWRCQPKVHTVTASEALCRYQVSPASDPVRQWLEVEGPGPSLHLFRKGSPDFFSFHHLAQSLIEEGLSDLEKALRIYRFSARHFHGADSPGWGCTEMTRFINTIGNFYCWGQADFQILLYRAAGLRARHPVLKGHSSVEVWIDGKWRMMDAFVRLIVPSPELDGLATGEELSKQLSLFDAVRPGSDVTAVRDYWSLHEAGGVYQPHEDNQAMNLHLRRGESVRFDLDRREAWALCSHEIRDFCNGDWRWRPSLDADHLKEETAHVANVEADGGGLRAADASARSSLIYRVSSPWPLIGGTVRWEWDSAQTATLEYFDPESTQWIEVGTSGDAGAAIEVTKILSAARLPNGEDIHLRPMEREVIHERVFRLSWKGSARLQSLDFQFLLQAHRPSIPQLTKGDNEWTLLAGAPGATIRHGWTEYPDLSVSCSRPRRGETVEIRGVLHWEGEGPLEDVPVSLRQKGRSEVLAEGRVDRVMPGSPAEVVLRWKAEAYGDRWNRVEKRHSAYVQTDLQLVVGEETDASGSLSPIAEATLVVLCPRAPRIAPEFVRRKWDPDSRSGRLRIAVIHPWPLSEGENAGPLNLQDVSSEAVVQLYRGHPRDGETVGEPQTVSVLASEFEFLEWDLPAELEKEDLWISLKAPEFEESDMLLEVKESAERSKMGY